VVEFREVRFTRNEQTIFNDVSFTINTDERVAILGGSGVGKTTMLKLILGLVRPENGSILIDGVDITESSEREMREMRLKFSIVFQDGALFDSLDVGENVAFFLREHTRMKEDEIRKRIGELLGEVGLPVSAQERMPEELSGGMQRRVAIARALAAQNPAMFLYDEPTSDLDPVTAERVLGMVDHLTKGGRGFIMVTHEVFHAYKAANRFMLLKNGSFVFDGGRRELIREDNENMRSFVGDFYWRGLQAFAEKQAVGVGNES